MAEEPDPLRSAFDELRSSALPSMQPLGVDGVRTTVRRRRNTRTGVAVFAVLLVAGFAYGIGTIDFGGSGGVAPGGGAPHLTGPSALGGASPAPSISLSASPSGTPRAHRTPPAHATAKKPCASDGIGVLVGVEGFDVVEKFGTLNGRVEPPCGGVAVPLFWASYTVNPDGTGSLFASGTASLGTAHQSVSMPMQVPEACGAWVAGHDVSSIPSTLPASTLAALSSPTPGGAFWDGKHNLSGVVSADRTPCTTPSNSPSPPASPAA